MRVAVTGATGFIGRYLVEELARLGHVAVALSRDRAALALLARDGVELRETSYEEADLSEALAGADAIVHLAGRRTLRDDEPLRFWKFAEANLRTLEALLFAARAAGVGRFVFASTTAVYSQANLSPYREDDPVFPINPYGLSKLYSEQMVALWARATPITAFSLRIATCYGHGERVSAVLMRFIDDAIAGRPLTIRGNRQTSVEAIYVRDVVDAIVAAITSAGPGGTVNVGSGAAASLIEMASTVNDVFGNAGGLVLADSHDADAPRNVMRIARASELLGWKPSRSLREGLEDFRDTRLRREASAPHESGTT